MRHGITYNPYLSQHVAQCDLLPRDPSLLNFVGAKDVNAAV